MSPAPDSSPRETDMSALSQRGHGQLVCGSSPETWTALHSGYCSRPQGPSNMGCSMLIAPAAQPLFGSWREDGGVVSFHPFAAFFSYCFTFAALVSPSGNFKIGRKVVRPVWKDFQRLIPHCPPIQRALRTSAQSG